MSDRLSFELPNGNRLRAALLMASIVIVLAYAWLSVRLLEPEYSISPLVVDGIFWSVGGQLRDFAEVRTRHQVEAEHLANAVLHVENAVRLLGAFIKPPLLIIDESKPKRYSVTENKVHLGIDFILAEGQVEKALYKSWLLQNAPGLMSDSLFRLESASDFLVLTLSGGDFLFEPERDELGFAAGMPIEIPPLRNWLRFAATFEQACHSHWRSFELGDLCSAKPHENSPVSEMSFRPLLTGLLWRSYQEIPILDRHIFLKSWIAHLKQESQKPPLWSPRGSKTLAQWKYLIRENFEALWLVDSDSLRALEVSLSLADLKETDLIQVDHLLVTEQLRKPRPQNSNFTFSFVIAKEKSVENGEQVKLFPQNLNLMQEDFNSVQARSFYWLSCRAPALGELAQASHQAEQIHFIRDCGETAPKIHLALSQPLGQTPGQSANQNQFAKSNPGLEFAMLNASALKWSLDHKIISSEMDVDALLMQRTSPYWGLASAQWRSDVKAFRVKGAVELVDWYRPKN